MADRLTAQQMTDYSGRNIRNRVTRTLNLSHDDGTVVTVYEVTPSVKSWGSIKTSVYNAGPKDRGELVIPTVAVVVDNNDGTFNMGGPIFPNGRKSLAEYTASLVVSVDGMVVVDFTGLILEPSYDATGLLTLTIEHPLGAAVAQKWTRDDRYGGDTGVNESFA